MRVDRFPKKAAYSELNRGQTNYRRSSNKVGKGYKKKFKISKNFMGGSKGRSFEWIGPRKRIRSCVGIRELGATIVYWQ